MVQKKVLDVKGGEEGELSYQGTSYYLRDRLWVQCLDLQVSRSWHSISGQLADSPTIRTTLSGTSQPHPKLSIIGYPQHSTRSVLLRIHEGDIEAGLKHREITADDAFGLATIGVYLANKDHELDDVWLLECELPSDCFKSLVEAVEARRLSYLNFGLSLKDLYSDNDWMASAKDDRVRFLRPPHAENELADRPHNAWGHIRELDFGLEKIKMVIAKPESETVPEEVAAPLSPSEAQLPVVSGLNEAIAALRKRMKLCIGLIVALVAYIAFR